MNEDIEGRLARFIELANFEGLGSNFTNYLCCWGGYKEWTGPALEWAFANGRADVNEMRKAPTGRLWKVGYTKPIHWVSFHGNVHALNVLLKHGANVNERSGLRAIAHRRGKKGTCLPIECALGFVNKANKVYRDCAIRLVDAGADLSLSDAPLPAWIVTYWRERNQLRLLTSIVLIAKKRGHLQQWDRYLVSLLGSFVWALRSEIEPGF